MPKTWSYVPIKSILLSIYGGGTPDKSKTEYWNGGDIYWCSVKDLGSDRYISKTKDKITKLGLINSSSKIVKANDFILCTRMSVGTIRQPKMEMAINQDLKGLILSEQVDKDWFYYLIQSLNFKGTGTTVSGIKLEEFANYFVGLPPYKEQKRISTKLGIITRLIS